MGHTAWLLVAPCTDLQIFEHPLPSHLPDAYHSGYGPTSIVSSVDRPSPYGAPGLGVFAGRVGAQEDRSKQEIVLRQVGVEGRLKARTWACYDT